LGFLDVGGDAEYAFGMFDEDYGRLLAKYRELKERGADRELLAKYERLIEKYAVILTPYRLPPFPPALPPPVPKFLL
jgi:hypothetical protein